MDFPWQWIPMNNEFPFIMHFQLEGNSLDNKCIFIRHFPLQWIPLSGGFEQARQGDYQRISLYKTLPLEWISLYNGFPPYKGFPCKRHFPFTQYVHLPGVLFT